MECTKCGVVLCEKNWLLIKRKNSSTLYPGIRCKQCVHKNKSCHCTYTNIDLEILSLKRMPLINEKLWKIKNKERRADIRKKIWKKGRDLITDTYVRVQLKDTHDLKNEEITLELITIKRNQIILRRWLK